MSLQNRLVAGPSQAPFNQCLSHFPTAASHRIKSGGPGAEGGGRDSNLNYDNLGAGFYVRRSCQAPSALCLCEYIFSKEKETVLLLEQEPGVSSWPIFFSFSRICMCVGVFFSKVSCSRIRCCPAQWAVEKGEGWALAAKSGEDLTQEGPGFVIAGARQEQSSP